jgi:hypothetical protein
VRFEYYYNNVPEHGLCRNNLIYTSLISEDKKTFCQWYYNDKEYHKNQNQVVDSSKMGEKWSREVKYLHLMAEHYPQHVPKIIGTDTPNRKIYLEIEGPDFWELSGCKTENYDKVLPDWREQMLEIIKAHKSLGLFKYSMHPSSYFIIDGKLKSINYFFTYHKDEPYFSIKDVESHIYSTRQTELHKYLESVGVSWDKPEPFEKLEQLCWESFRTNYPVDFINQVKSI